MDEKKLRKLDLAKYAKLLLGCYRTGDANDAEVYATAIVAVLSDYPIDVIEAVVDPRNGLPSRLKWLPTVAEVKAACEEIEGPRRRIREWDRAAARQLAERENDTMTEQEKKLSYQDIVERFAAVGVHIGDQSKYAPPVDVEAIKKQHNLTQAQWDAIPNQPHKIGEQR